MAPDVARDFATACRVADYHHVFQIERIDQLGQVVRVGVHVVTVPGLVGAAMPAAVMRNHAVAALAQKHHLRIPGVAAQRPAVGEDNGLPTAPVLIENPCSILGSKHTHGVSPSSSLMVPD